jgi:hypothetical protein
VPKMAQMEEGSIHENNELYKWNASNKHRRIFKKNKCQCAWDAKREREWERESVCVCARVCVRAVIGTVHCDKQVLNGDSSTNCRLGTELNK